MTYELAKKLKDAGFPQVIKADYYHEGCDECFGGNAELYEKAKDSGFDSNDISIPTLPELIEACGEKFFYLERLDNLAYKGWVAHAIFTGTDEKVIAKNGSTPEEAVANLWLKLNQSNDKKIQN